ARPAAAAAVDFKKSRRVGDMPAPSRIEVIESCRKGGILSSATAPGELPGGLIKALRTALDSTPGIRVYFRLRRSIPDSSSAKERPDGFETTCSKGIPKKRRRAGR